MKPEDIKRIAEIIGLEPKCSEDGPFVCLVRDKDKHAVNFQPDTHWYSTGMLLEWLHSEYPDFHIINNRVSDTGLVDNALVFVDYVRHGATGETLQLAICNAVLSVGEEE